MNIRLISAILLFLPASPAIADTTDIDKISIKGRIVSTLSISSAAKVFSNSASLNKPTSAFTAVTNHSDFYDCEYKNCSRIYIQGVANSFYSISLLNNSAKAVACKTVGKSLSSTGVLNLDGKNAYLCSFDKKPLSLNEMTIVMTLD